MTTQPATTKPESNFRPNAAGPKQIVRQSSEGLNVRICEHSGICEFHISARPLPGENLSILFGRIAALLKEHDAKIVRQEVFGSIDAYEATEGLLHDLFGDIAWPLNWIDGDSTASGISGTHIVAISGVEIECIRLNGKTVATVFRDKWAKHCLIGNIIPANVSASQAAQTENAYQNFQAALASAGMDIGDVVRTWFFLDNILSWYDEFNKVRNGFYSGRNLHGKTFPASTGVSGRNPEGGALSLAAWAMQPLDSQTDFTEVPSPLQCPAPNYGSGFSRAAEMVTPEYRRLLVSGTASIFPDGRSAHDGDIAKQITLTMEVVRGILESRDLTYADITRATLYFKDIAQAGAFDAWCTRNNVVVPAISTQADVCRDELLFEIELDALVELNL
ncbi:MAG: hypothetical protein H0X66_17305 [Verrucomicrobia bacterium]|nr:hypothetical protein [Verrucomicrobiota bacterium]